MSVSDMDEPATAEQIIGTPRTVPTTLPTAAWADAAAQRVVEARLDGHRIAAAKFSSAI
jgi:hypothetical protein